MMGKLYNNAITTTAGFKYTAEQPLDDRDIVERFEDLATLVNDHASYEGMRVYVTADQKSYELKNDGWEAIASENFVEDKLNDKVDKVTGKGLSTNDFTDSEKSKLASIAQGAEANVQADWEQTDETAPDYVKNRTHYITEDIVAEWDGDTTGKTSVLDFYKISDTCITSNDFNQIKTNFSTISEYYIENCKAYDSEYDGHSIDNGSFAVHLEDKENKIIHYPMLIVVQEAGNYEFIDYSAPQGDPGSENEDIIETSHSYFDCIEPGIYVSKHASDFVLSISNATVQQLNERFIPDTIARVDHYDKYDKDSFSANDTAKAISAKSAAFGFNTQAGSYAFTILDLDATNKTFTLDSTEGLDVGDVYTVDLSFYNASDVAAEELYENYGKITAISADNVVTVDTFPSDVARYRVPDEPYIDENGLDGEENVFRVIAKPNVGNRTIGTKTFATGNGSKALSKNAVAMGAACIAYGAHSVAIGYDNKTTYAATSFGRANTASGVNSVAIGYKNTSAGNGTVAMGQQNTSKTSGAVAIGILNEATTRASIALGEKNTANGEGAIALGYNNTSSGERSFAAGHSNEVIAVYASALGYANIVSENGAFAAGAGNTVSGYRSFAGGHINKVQGKYSIALGYNNTSSGEGSIAFGNSNTSSNKGSFASGTSNKATGTNSFALGSTNRATGTSSFAHGYNNDATQTGSAVFGTNSKSQGGASFAAGASVEATGYYSQAFGQKTKAIGACSFAEGEGTIAKGKHQHVQGKYNIEDTANKYAYIIGNGTAEITDQEGNITTPQVRSNAHTIDWDGNAWFAGAVSASSIKIGEVEFTSAQLIKVLNFIDSIEV